MLHWCYWRKKKFHCIHLFRIDTFSQLTAQTCSFFHHLGIYELCFTCCRATRIYSPNITLMLLYTIMPPLLVCGWLCMQSKQYWLGPNVQTVAMDSHLLTSCWGNKWKVWHTHIFCVEEKRAFKFHWRFIKSNATCHVLFLIKRLQCLHQKRL